MLIPNLLSTLAIISNMVSSKLSGRSNYKSQLCQGSQNSPCLGQGSCWKQGKWESRLGRFVQLISGHNNLNYQMSLCNPGHTDKWRFCNQDKETFFPFCTTYPVFTLTWSSYYLHYEDDFMQSWDHKSILAFSYIPAINNEIESYRSSGTMTPNHTQASQ